MAEADARPAWVRLFVPRRARRAEILVRCWAGVVLVALSLPLLLAGMPGYRWIQALPALFAAETVWQWLALRWVDRHRLWPPAW